MKFNKKLVIEELVNLLHFSSGGVEENIILNFQFSYI